MTYSCSLSCFKGISKFPLFNMLSGAKSSIASATSIGTSSSSVHSGVLLMGLGEGGLARLASGCALCWAESCASGALAASSPCCTKYRFLSSWLTSFPPRSSFLFQLAVVDYICNPLRHHAGPLLLPAFLCDSLVLP